MADGFLVGVHLLTGVAGALRCISWVGRRYPLPHARRAARKLLALVLVRVAEHKPASSLMPRLEPPPVVHRSVGELSVRGAGDMGSFDCARTLSSSPRADSTGADDGRRSCAEELTRSVTALLFGVSQALTRGLLGGQSLSTFLFVGQYSPGLKYVEFGGLVDGELMPATAACAWAELPTGLVAAGCSVNCSSEDGEPWPERAHGRLAADKFCCADAMPIGGDGACCAC